MDDFENSDGEASFNTCKIEKISDFSRFEDVRKSSNNGVVANLFTGKIFILKLRNNFIL